MTTPSDFSIAVAKLAEVRSDVTLSKAKATSAGFGNRGQSFDRIIRAKGRPVGELAYFRHPEGHAEVHWLFLDDEKHRGKGYGRAALHQLIREHGAVLSDTRGGTTRSAQKAMRALMADLPGVEVHQRVSRELSGKKFTDTEKNPTSIWYAHLPGKGTLSARNLDDIEYNSRYHRRRQGRMFGGALAGALGGGLSAIALEEKFSTGLGPFGFMLSSGAGALAGGMAANRLQYSWDKKRNLRGDW